MSRIKSDERSAYRERLYQKIDELLAAPEYQDFMVPEEPGPWEDRLIRLAESLADDRRCGGLPPTAYRRGLVRLAAEAIAAIEAHDRLQRESSESAAPAAAVEP